MTTETDNYVKRGVALIAEGKLRRPAPEKYYTGLNQGTEWGWIPNREDCTPIEDFTWPTFARKVVEETPFGNVAREIRAPIPGPLLRNLSHTYAKENCGFEWAVSFRIIDPDGNDTGTFYANEWGWEYV